MPRPSALALALLAAVAASAAGCSTGARAARGPALRPDPVASPGGSGFASFGRRVRLNAEGPSLAALEEEARARRAAEERANAAVYGSYGPSGDPGVIYLMEGGGYAVVQTGPHLVPGGAYGYPRVPHDPPAHRSPYAAPYASIPGPADVHSHRPGLSTGSGVFARDPDDDDRRGHRHR